VDSERLVRAGYERVGERYEEWSERVDSAPRDHYVSVFEDLVVEDGRVVELGCGTGLATRVLVQRFNVVAVDFSARCLAHAMQSAPSANYVLADITRLAFPSRSLDRVACFYSLIHIPREKQPDVLESAAAWLRPGGAFVATMGSHDLPSKVETDWLGAPMFWSFYDAPTNISMVRNAGFRITDAAEVTQHDDGKAFSLLWIAAVRE
jgi:SAM-dependent methyltransferase